MLALLLVIIILIIFMIGWILFLTLKQRELNPLPEISCPKCPEPPKVVCPDLPDIKCPECPKCPELPKIPYSSDSDNKVYGFKLNPVNNDMKKLFKIIGDLNLLFQDIFCSKKHIIIEFIKNMNIKKEDKTCSEILKEIKENLINDAQKAKEYTDKEWSPSDKQIDDVTSKIIELFELLFSDLVCNKKDKIGTNKVKKLLINIINSFCD